MCGGGWEGSILNCDSAHVVPAAPGASEAAPAQQGQGQPPGMARSQGSAMGSPARRPPRGDIQPVAVVICGDE